MIRNETALRVSRNKLADLIAHRDVLQARSAAIIIRASDEAVMQGMEVEAMNDLITQVRVEIEEFNATWNSKPEAIEVGSIAELPRAVIKAWIAAGLTLNELASRTGLHESAIQRYERNGYESASCQRLQTLLDATGIRVRLVEPEPSC